MTRLSVACPECDEVLDVEADVDVSVDHHPYGSTTAAQTTVDVQVGTIPDCPNCKRTTIDDEAVIEEALAEMDRY